MALIDRSHSKRNIHPASFVLALITVAALGFGGYFYVQYKNLKDTSSKSADEINQELITQVNKVYELPKDQTPVVALVSDEAKFKAEYPVFTSAKQGDNLLLYEKAGLAVLYRSSEKKVVGTATFAVKRSASLYLVASADKQPAVEAQLTKNYDVELVGKASPATLPTQSSVFDATGKNTELVAKIAAELGATVVSSSPLSTPPSENPDIVVLIGAPQPQVEVSTPPVETP
jgi:hypothetical protein